MKVKKAEMSAEITILSPRRILSGLLFACPKTGLGFVLSPHGSVRKRTTTNKITNKAIAEKSCTLLSFQFN